MLHLVDLRVDWMVDWEDWRVGTENQNRTQYCLDLTELELELELERKLVCSSLPACPYL